MRYILKTPYWDGTTHIALLLLDLVARLAAVVLPPRMHLMRFDDVFLAHSMVCGAGAWRQRCSRLLLRPRLWRPTMWQ